MIRKTFIELAATMLLAFPPIGTDLQKIFKGYPSGRLLPSGEFRPEAIWKHAPVGGQKCLPCRLPIGIGR